MNKIIKKSVILFILLILLVIQLFAGNRNSKYEQNTEYTAIDMKKDYARNFIALITYAEYELAYDLLTDECKQKLFGNSVENFEEVIKTKIYDYGKLNKTFTYEDAVECLEDDKTVYSQKVHITHRSLGTEVPSIEELGYDIYDYTSTTMINFIIYEEFPYNYKMNIQLVEE